MIRQYHEGSAYSSCKTRYAYDSLDYLQSSRRRNIRQPIPAPFCDPCCRIATTQPGNKGLQRVLQVAFILESSFHIHPAILS